MEPYIFTQAGPKVGRKPCGGKQSKVTYTAGSPLKLLSPVQLLCQPSSQTASHGGIFSCSLCQPLLGNTRVVHTQGREGGHEGGVGKCQDCGGFGLPSGHSSCFFRQPPFQSTQFPVRNWPAGCEEDRVGKPKSQTFSSKFGEETIGGGWGVNFYIERNVPVNSGRAVARVAQGLIDCQ